MDFLDKVGLDATAGSGSSSALLLERMKATFVEKHSAQIDELEKSADALDASCATLLTQFQENCAPPEDWRPQQTTTTGDAEEVEEEEDDEEGEEDEDEEELQLELQRALDRPRWRL